MQVVVWVEHDVAVLMLILNILDVKTMTEKENDIVWKEKEMIIDATFETENAVIVDHGVRKLVTAFEVEVEIAKNENDDDQSKLIQVHRQHFSIRDSKKKKFTFLMFCREMDYDRRDSRRDRDREKERKRSKRSRSRERKRDKRDKSRDKRDKERKERKPEYGDIKIKEEPVDDGMIIFQF